MSDSYQAIYDAVRSRISNGDVGNAIASVAHQSFDISRAVVCLTDDISTHVQRVSEQHLRPCVVFRPALSIDGNKWFALYGANFRDGVAGFGDSPELAMQDFDRAWIAKISVQP